MNGSLTKNRLIRAAVACLLVAGGCHAGAASEADLIIPESLSFPQPIHLTEKSERQAEAIARYLQAIFEEETEGPDKAMETKRKVLLVDPAFTDLSIDVAHQYLRHGETSEAITVLKDAAKASRNDPVPLLALAAIYLRQLQKTDLAEKFALQALALTPDDAAPYATLWEIYRTTSQPQKTDALFHRALKQKDAGAVFWIELAELRTRESPSNGTPPGEAMVAGILPLLERSVLRVGDDAQTITRIADCFSFCGHDERAVSLYNRALTLHANLAGTREKLAVCLMRLGDTTAAVKLLEEIVRANPLDLSAYDQLARLYLSTKSLPKALTNLRQALLLAPADPMRYVDVIRFSFGTGDNKGALDTATEAEKKFPNRVEFTMYRAMALSEEKQHDEAIKAFEKTNVLAANSSPDLLDSDFYFNYGAAAEQAGQPVKAVELLRKSIELDPAKAARACNYLGYMWAERNENLAEAAQLVQRALESDPNNGAYLDTLGWVYFRQGKFPEALGELLRAAERISAPDAVGYEHIGDTYEKLGKSAEAVLYWQKALHENQGSKSLPAKLDVHSSRVVQQPKPPGTRAQP